MEGIEIAKLVMSGIGALMPLVSNLIGASKEDAEALKKDVETEIANMVRLIRSGGTMEAAFEENDAKLDKVIADAESKT